MRKAIGGTMIGLAFLAFMVGLIIVACETPTLAGQMRNAGIGFVTMGLSVLLGLAGEKIGAN